MSLKKFIAVGVSAFALSFAGPAVAQDSGAPSSTSSGDTTQTDQSEDDWRRSKRKDSTGDYDPISNPMSGGLGNIMITTEPIDQLPPESRRHLKRQRALAIAGMGPDGDMQDVAYEPSAGAQADPNLAAEEKAVWDEMMKELGSGSGSGTGQMAGDASSSGPRGQEQTGQGQSAGQGNGQASGQGQQAGRPSSPQAMRGGSTASASDILSQMRGLGRGDSASQQAGDSRSGTNQGAAQGRVGGGAAGQNQGQNQGQTQTQQGSSGGGQSSSTSPASRAQTATQTADGQQQAQNPQGGQAPVDKQTPVTGRTSDAQSVLRGGASSSASDILNQMQNTGDTAPPQSARPDRTITAQPRVTPPPIASRDYETSGTNATSASDYLRQRQRPDDE